uniref:Uncharacterized protein n=1 Tax=Sphaerodactylus townsendi TaxID=933632 RepID=A0ACB8E6N9_9SAUR
MLALRRQFEHPFKEEKALVRLQQIRQRSQSRQKVEGQDLLTGPSGEQVPAQEASGTAVVSLPGLCPASEEVGGPEFSEESAGKPAARSFSQ